MNLQIIIEILAHWKIVVVSLLVMILLPVVFYVASIDKNKNKGFQSTISEPKIVKGNKNSRPNSIQTTDKEAELADEKDNNQGSERT